MLKEQFSPLVAESPLTSGLSYGTAETLREEDEDK